MDKEITLLVADDHPMVRMGLAAMIEAISSFRLVGEAEDGLETLQKYQKLNPDIVLMDLNMPVMDGITSIQRILEVNPDAKVICMTAFSDTDLTYRALNAGAVSIIEKQITLMDFEAAVRMALEGRSWISKNTLSQMLKRSREDAAAEEDYHLTIREQEIARMLAHGNSNAAIASDLGMSINTVKKYMSILFAKLNVTNRAEAAAIISKSRFIEKRV